MSLRSGMIALLMLPLAATTALAADVQVESAWASVRDGAIEVTASTKFPVDDRVRRTLASGATLNVDLQVVIERRRRHWWNATLADVTLRRAISWNGVTLRYEVRDLAHETLRSFITLDEALSAAGHVVDWPIELDDEYDPDASYRIRVRAGYRRGSLPGTLRALMPWSDGWNRSSEWSTWILPR